MNTLKHTVLCLSLLLSMTATAQILAPARWQYELTKQFVKQGDMVELVFKVTLDDTWHLYSNIQNYDIGPLPTSFNFEKNDTFKLIGDIKPIGNSKAFDDVFEVNVNYFEHTAEFRQKVQILSNNPIIKGAYEYQVCNEVDGKCLFLEDDFDLTRRLSNKPMY